MVSPDLHDGSVVLLSRGPHPSSNPDAPVVVVEYADLQCSACRTAHENIVKPLLVHFGTRILFEVRHFPPTSIHRHALDAAQAAECAADQGKFWEYEEGSGKGVEGTPTFFVNGVMVKSKLGAIQRAIEAAMGSVGQRS